MKNLQILVLVILSAISTISYAQDDQIVVNLSDPDSPGTLNVGLIRGFIHVTGGTNKDVIIQAKVEKDQYPDDSELVKSTGMKQITGVNDGFELTVTEKNNIIKVGTGHPNQKLNLSIQIPQNFALKLSAVNSGDILVENVNGNMEISNVNDNVILKNVSGSAIVTTVNGDILASFMSVLAETPMVFTTLNGDVDVTLPISINADLKVQSDQGEVLSDFDIDIIPSQPEVVRITDGNMQKITKSGWTMGKINGGGAEIMMKTMNGDIIIRKGE